jgi:hypothetical protein
MIRLLEFLVVAWLPGAVLFRAPIADRDRRAALAAEERAFWAVVLSAALSLTIVLALAAAHRYSFKRLLIVDLVVTGVIAAAGRFRLGLGSHAPRPGVWALIPVALIAMGLWRFFPPAEYIIGGKDPGVYINEGIQIAQRGALVVRDEDVAAVPAFARDLFFPFHQNPTYYSNRFMGFFLQSPDTGEVVGQFPHLYPASIAIGYGIDGLTGARRAVETWAILGLLSVYFAGARLLGRTTAAAGAVLLALSVIDVWFSRYPNAEVLMQALLFAALLANARAHVDGDRFFAPVAGFLLGLLLFLRFDAVIGVAGVLTGIALGCVAGQRPRWTFWPPLLLGAVLCAWYLGGPMRAYAALPIGFLWNLALWQQIGITAAVAAIIFLVIGARRLPGVSRLIVTWTPTVLGAVVIALAVYAYAFRRPVGPLAPFDAYALRTFASFYLTVPGLIAALIGYALVARGLFWRDPAFLVTLTAFSLFFFYKIRIVPEHFWMTRRFLPMILPGMLLIVASAALVGVRGRWFVARAVRIPIGIVFLVLLAASYARAARPLLEHVEYAGVIPKLEQLATTVGGDDLLIVESRNASDIHVLALPLAYIYARHVLVLATPVPDKTIVAAFLDRAHARYRRVLFMGGGGTDLLSPQWSVAPIVSDRFQVPEYDAPTDAYPRFVRQKEFDYTIYAFGAPTHDDTPVDLDLGVNDDLNVLRFHAKEKTEGRTFRWSRDRSYVTLTRIQPDSHTITIWMSNGGRPPAAPPADVVLLIGTRPLGSARVTAGFRPYEFSLPADIATAAASSGEPLRLLLQTTVWNPHRTLGSADDRDLGVMVDRVSVR